ncbi:hypothetical protein SAMN05192544_102838 [Paraburkholderia hospita]|nr:hypothetical protein SAMN05192544_102838 [Paraburkholderia hospita]
MMIMTGFTRDGGLREARLFYRTHGAAPDCTTKTKRAPRRLFRYIEARLPGSGGTLRSGGAAKLG